MKRVWHAVFGHPPLPGWRSREFAPHHLTQYDAPITCTCGKAAEPIWARDLRMDYDEATEIETAVESYVQQWQLGP